MSYMFKKALLGITLAASMLGGTGSVAFAQTNQSKAVTTEEVTATESTTTEKAATETTEKASDSEENTTEVVSSETSTYKVKIGIQLEKAGWYNESANVKVTAEPLMKYKNFKIDTVEAKIGSNGSWVDITDDMVFEITENCTVYVKVTDQDGAEYEKARYIKCFDSVAPTLNAAVSEGLLNVLTYDTESGVKSVYINEYSFTPDDNGIVSVRLQKFDASYQYFYIYAIDNAGNASSVYTINNPYYKDSSTEEDDEDDDTDPADSLPDNAEAEVTNPSTGEVTSVTDEDGNDISTEVNMKQFYTIVTQDGQQYFLVIDMSSAYSDDDGVDTTGGNGTVYFLTSVSNQNLLNFVDSDETTLPQNSVAVSNGIDDTTYTPDMDESVTDEEEEDTEEVVEESEPEGSTIPSWLYIVGFMVIAAIVVGVKSLTGKKGKPEQSDDAYYGEEENDEEDSLDSLNEDEDE